MAIVGGLVGAVSGGIAVGVVGGCVVLLAMLPSRNLKDIRG